jgi:hypothetical protein
LFICLLLLFQTSFYSNFTHRAPVEGVNDLIRIGDIIISRVFSNYINVLDYSIYGYHNQSSVWKIYRVFGYIYSFEQLPGNAVFLNFYGLFGSLFGPKGIVYNSPFLLFSILGIFAYKNKKKRNLILVFTILFILLYGLLHFMWYGGVTPRYNRYLTIPVLFLTFFSFYYIQETNSNWIRLIFIGLIILSILNVISIAIRADWTYEHGADLVSYDLVLWPWYPPKPTKNIINLYLTEQGESVEWKFGTESECKAYGSLEGIITYVCNCEYATYAERSIKIPWDKFKVNVTVCSRNGDVIGEFYFDKTKKEIIIPPNSCEEKSLLVDSSKEEHTIILKSKKYGECIDEVAIWKLITIEKQ